MTRIHLAAALFTAFAAVPALGQSTTWLFTMSQPEQTLSGSGGLASLSTIRPNEVAMARIGTTCGNSAEKWAARSGWNTVAGDTNLDSIYLDPTVFGGIDALLLKPFRPASQSTLYFSPAQDLDPTISGPPGLRAGDVGAIRRIGTANGQVEHFLTAEDVQIGLGLPPSPPVIDIDAVCMDFNRNIYFSLEDDILAFLLPDGILTPMFLQDGDILQIPFSAITYDANMNVAGIAPNAIRVVLSEAAIDAQLAGIGGVGNHLGACTTAIGDVDALEHDVFGTAFSSVFGTTPMFYPDLVFGTENLTGLGALTTGGGTVAPHIVPPCGPWAGPCGPANMGAHLGIAPTSTTVGPPSSLNGLAFRRDRVCRFLTDTPTPYVPTGSTIQVDIAAQPGIPFVFLFASLGPIAPGGIDGSVANVWNPTPLCFPDVYLPIDLPIGFVFLDPQGFGSYSVTVSLPAAAAFQAVSFSGSLEFSNPATVQLY